MRDLAFDDYRQMPIPWFVFQEKGKAADFRVADEAKRVKAVKLRLCWCCGKKLPKEESAFLVGPMCEITQVTSEPPMHVDCAEYAVMICPFLGNPAMKRSPRPIRGDASKPSGHGIPRNPGVTALIVSKYPARPFSDRMGGWLLQLPVAKRVFYFRERRPATVDEVWHSCVTGLPALYESARAEGMDAVIDVTVRAEVYRRRLAELFGKLPQGPEPTDVLAEVVAAEPKPERGPGPVLGGPTSRMSETQS
jgi:hypothetical protein